MGDIEKVYGFKGTNPFLDINGRDFSDEAILEEFCPTNQFWSLFNNQHEILVGTRGSGKTFLLKMLRMSMLSKIDDPHSKQIISSKKFISFYIALQMERMATLDSTKRHPEEKIQLFRFIFNSCLANSIISEANKHCNEIGKENKRKAVLDNTELAGKLYRMWFNKNSSEGIIDLDDLSMHINRVYYNFDFHKSSIDLIPSLFVSDLCAPLTSAGTLLANFFGTESPTWILAIDEAEFVKEHYQRIINSFMRSNPMHIIFKIATLPYYWSTLETLNGDIELSNGNDFNYRVVDMDSDKDDFKKLTNKVCSNRLKKVSLLDNTPLSVKSLEDFLGTLGKDKRIDYFKNEMEINSDDEIKKGIINSLSDNRNTHKDSSKNISQTIYKKFAPIYYVREIYKKKSGRYIPQWFAGSEVVRKVSQGNPRMFINLMSQLFAYAINHKKISIKDQHKIITAYAHNVCESTKAIEKDGDTIYKNLSTIATILNKKTHGGKLLEVGCSFVFKKGFDLNSEETWIKRAISFSRLSVDETTIENGLSADTKFVLCNAFAVEYWLTMRSDYPTKLSLKEEKNEEEYQRQLSLI